MIRHLWFSLPRLIRFMLKHIANGMVVGCVVTFALIWLDLFGLGRLLGGSALATFLLFFQMSFTFGAVFMGVAVMRLGRPEK
jgi:predicted benzoate:H+ symporter BenE